MRCKPSKAAEECIEECCSSRPTNISRHSFIHLTISGRFLCVAYLAVLLEVAVAGLIGSPLQRAQLRCPAFVRAPMPGVTSSSVSSKPASTCQAYALLWVRKGDKFVVAREFTTDARKEALRRARQDDKTFSSESRQYAFPVEGDGPIATSARTQKETIVTDFSKMVRRNLAEEFGIKKVHFVPLPDGSVIEYGTPSSEDVQLAELVELSAMALSAAPLDDIRSRAQAAQTLTASVTQAHKTPSQCQAYSILWVRKGNTFVVAKEFTTEARKEALRKLRRDDKTFSSESRRFSLASNGNGPIATSARTQKETVVTDTSRISLSMISRRDLAKEFGIKKIHLVPLPDGSVIEYGTPNAEDVAMSELVEVTSMALAGASFATQAGRNQAARSLQQSVAISHAPLSGCQAYSVLWVRKGDKFVAARDFTTDARKEALFKVRHDTKTFSGESMRFAFSATGYGPIATSARTQTETVLTDFSNMKRQNLAKEFGITRIHFVPLPDGSVVEYGTPSKEDVQLSELVQLSAMAMDAASLSWHGRAEASVKLTTSVVRSRFMEAVNRDRSQDPPADMSATGMTVACM